LSGRQVVIAPGRARRPGSSGPRIEPATSEELESCPFDAGREDRTPPETLRLGEPWQVRVVPNLYPAFERQEVVIHTPSHVRSLAELPDSQLDLVAQAWRARRRAEPDGYLHALVNEGRAAGASLPHSHSQLVWLREPPPALTDEENGECRLCALLEDEHGDGRRIVAHRADLDALCPRAGRVPYELLLAPRRHRGDAFGDDLGDSLALLAELIRRLRTVEGPVPWNAWLHDGAHWHVEVVPRLTVFAGIELGAGVYVNTLAPEDGAATLRAAG
jgi:UDPglucose--hexose-1-phosphate uridylyltransferase